MSDKVVRRFEKLSAEERKTTLDRLNVLSVEGASEKKAVKKSTHKLKKVEVESGSDSESSDEKPKKGRRERKTRDPNAPKRAMTGYICYSKDRRPSAKAEYPSLTPRQLTAKMAEEWNSMSEAQKAPFNEQSNADKARYKMQRDNYKKSE